MAVAGKCFIWAFVTVVALLVAGVRAGESSQVLEVGLVVVFKKILS